MRLLKQMGKLREVEIGKIRLLLTDKTLTDVQKYYLKTYLASLIKDANQRERSR